MITAFQANAFQNDAFQIDTGAVVIITPPLSEPRGSGGWQKKRRSGLYWPRKGKKKTEEQVVAAVIVEVLEHEQVPQREIDVGLLAVELIQHYGYRELRQIDQFDIMIKLIRRELEELDDEEALMWLL